MKLVITTFLTLDGVMQSPGAPEEDNSGGFERGGWLGPYFSEDMGHIMSGWIKQADGFLLGRRTYEIFAGFWPHVTDPNDAVAAALNGQPKYVASTTLKKVEWKGATLIQGNVVEAVAELKRKPGRELQVHGSCGLAQTLIQEGLIDEYRLWIFPVLIGAGKRLFGTGTVPAALRLIETRTAASGVLIHSYAPAGKPQYVSVV